MPKYALITGCSAGGIGDALAKEFHTKGVHVFATARNLSKIEHLKSLGLTTVKLDVTSSKSIEEAVAEISKTTGGKLDFLVNNAGMGNTMPLLDVKLETAREVFELNYISVLAMTQAFAPSLIAAKGKVINIGSIVGRLAQAYTGVYNTSKAAANLLSETLRVELAPFGVEVITVVTGVIATEFFNNQGSVELPADSLYLPIQSYINDTAAGKELSKSAMTASAFAQGLVANAMKPRSNLWYWRGGNALLVWAVTTFAPHLMTDTIFASTNGTKVLAEKSRNA
ncbi:hypothetical protein DL95DRAFT_494452 [Leptodontidium sp. 2 PMI_412]|nr:hypothetical protein BKA61DRAFT_552854 [Leptodontidium sp. MPI-SDFR-AT-0119]KAH9204836.1 hypothetical protein DL95DRAFT_494452 [Leptodontidium sp. 2 PMI_412]